MSGVEGAGASGGVGTYEDLTINGNTIMGDPGYEATGIDINGTDYNSYLKVSNIGASGILADIILHRHSTTLPINIVASRSNSDTAAHAAVVNNQSLLNIIPVGHDGTDYQISSWLSFEVDGTVSTGVVPGKMRLRTANASGTLTERLRINADGSWGLNGANYGTSGQVLTSNGAGAAPTWQAAGGGGIAAVVDDTTPQLGGNLDVNGQSIVSVSNGNINITPNGTGNVSLGNFTLDADQTVGAGQDNYVLTYNNSTGLISLEAASSPNPLITTIIKTADESRTSTTTLADDADLAYATSSGEIGKNILVEFFLAVNLGSAPGDIRVAVTYVGSKNTGSSGTWIGEATTGSPTTWIYEGNFNGNARSFAAGSAVPAILFRGLLKIVGTGTIKLQWAQDTSNATATYIREESFMRVTVLD